MNRNRFENIFLSFTLKLYLGRNSLTDLLKNQISSLFINLSDENYLSGVGYMCSIILVGIFDTCTNLQCLKINPSSSFLNALIIYMIDRTICSTLLELHVTVRDMNDCFCILDGRFDQLRILYVTCYGALRGFLQTEHKQKLPNLRIFSLCCEKEIHSYDESIVPLLHRMLNLEELDLNITVNCYEKFIDGDTLKRDIIVYMLQLYKFTFNICSIINHRNQTNFPLNEHIKNTFKNISNNQIITSIDHFQEKRYSQCHIYSYPYKWKIYNNLTNNFRGGLFTSVTQVSLYDEHPFEYELFLRIQISFPFMKELTIKNQKAQKYKQFIKSNNNNQILPIIEYFNLTRLDLNKTHDDYLELFLFDMNMSLPINLHLLVNYESLERVTYYFTRYITRNNCTKLAALYCNPVNQIDEHIKNYFPYTCIRRTYDY
ncbi:unnamed protein product [Rotaria sp. Silwood2]|nr:unnamed protein product [Rotaria sp. Silwood2]CAF2709335.1 unnamed protein product [Rotaria sp. Silwood2]CAF3114846.1 unnamed protein product [Rotaria sp. Silwood2]CAF4207503.1 unnamed protein product [Rotaria sp. Silwood2]CAF4313049.1 unnamed protein product [Rotaria sp. Silwood2]